MTSTSSVTRPGCCNALGYGFQPCDVDGVEIEPAAAAGWTSLYACQRCSLILDVGTYDPVGHTIASVIPGVVILGQYAADLTWTGADQARLQRFRDARAEVEATCGDPLGGDVVEFGDSVCYRVAPSRGGLFAVPISRPPRWSSSRRPVDRHDCGGTGSGGGVGSGGGGDDLRTARVSAAPSSVVSEPAWATPRSVARVVAYRRVVASRIAA